MKIFILNPLIYSSQKSIMDARPRQPLDLAYIVSLLFREGYNQVKFLDANVLNYDNAKTLEEIRNYNPSVLILTSAPVERWECPRPHIDSVFEIINSVNCTKILTGSHGSLTPNWIFEKCNVQFIVRGEPEITTLNLIKAIANNENFKNVAGISYRLDGEIYHNPDAPRIENLDSLPIPAYELLPMDKYKYTSEDLPQPFSIMLTSRGCPFNCAFCLKVMSKDKYIARSPESALEEIKYLVDKFGVKSIFFQDWEFTIDRGRVIKICDLILQNSIKLIWGCNARVTDLDDGFVKKMKESGCVRINIGFESGSQKILDIINKKISIEDLEKAIKICRANNINIGMYTMLNSPRETKETIKETIDFLKRNKINSMTPTFPIPYFGTTLFQQWNAKETKDKLGWDNIEDYAGEVDTTLSPGMARFFYRYFRFQSKFGKYFWLSPRFYKYLFKIRNK